MLIRGFKKWPRNQQIALPILSVFAFGALFNQMQARNSEPVSIHVENPRIIDGDTLETLDKKRVRLSGLDAPDEDGKGNVPNSAALFGRAGEAKWRHGLHQRFSGRKADDRADMQHAADKLGPV